MKINIILVEFLYIPSRIWFRTMKNWWFKNNFKNTCSNKRGGCLYLPDHYVVAILKKDISHMYYCSLFAYNHIIDEFEVNILEGIHPF